MRHLIQTTDELTQTLKVTSAVLAEAGASARHAATALDAINLQPNIKKQPTEGETNVKN